jgi:hypothetical protein
VLALAGACGDSSAPARDGSVLPADAAMVGSHDGAQAHQDAGNTPDGSTAADAGGEAAAEAGPPPGPLKKCVVMLHGKSGNGFAPQDRGDYLLVGPTGNADGWGGKQWIYFPDSELQTVQTIVGQAISENACTRVVIHGFSNGGAAAAKLFCRGNTFGNRVVGYVVDDPVPDHGADGCAPAAGVKVRLYWTSALAGTAQDGWDCASGDWTCEGGQTIGIQKYASRLGSEAVQSINTQHIQYDNPPEYQQWLAP